MIIVDALRYLAPNPSAAQVRDYIARLKGFAGINGLYDCVVMTLWSPTHHTWKIVSEPTGIPLGKQTGPTKQIN